MRLILGSQSPRRKQLLTAAGFSFEVRVSHAPEDYPDTLPLSKVPAYLAEKKAQALLPTLAEDEVLVCADSVVILENELLGKPESFTHAQQILRKLSNTTHKVITGVCVATAKSLYTFDEHTLVSFKPLTEAEILHYLQTAAPFDKAGSYGIQDWIGLIGVRKIDGCFYNVMGLPISSLYSVLKMYDFE